MYAEVKQHTSLRKTTRRAGGMTGAAFNWRDNCREQTPNGRLTCQEKMTVG